MSKKNKPAKYTAITEKTIIPSPSSEISKSGFWSGTWVLIPIILLTYLVFSPTFKYEYVNWDDSYNVYENPVLMSQTQDNFKATTAAIFKQKVIGNYNPLPIWTFALENKWYNTNKSGVLNGITFPNKLHRTNVLLHLICVGLVFFISRKLGLRAFGAAIVAILFGIHPMRVESVAWITERKDVLFGSFYLGAILVYLWNKEKPNLLRMIGVYVLFILSLFSKIQAVSLPLTLMALDYLLDKDFGIIRAGLSKALFFALSLGFGVLGLVTLKDQGSLTEVGGQFAVWQKIFIGSYSYCIYLIKLIIPYEMVPLYPYQSEFQAIYYPSIIVFFLLGFGLYHLYKKEWKWAVFVLLFFTVNIMFLLQIVGAGQGFLADRFTYIAYLGFFLGFGYLVDRGIGTLSKSVFQGIAAFACAVYCFVCVGQVKIWKNAEVMWSKVIEKYPNTTTPYLNRSQYLRDHGGPDLALADLNKAISLKTTDHALYNSRAKVYFDFYATDTAKLQLALADYNQAIKLDPKDGEYWVNRGAAYFKLGDITNALSNFTEGIKRKPEHTNGYINRAVCNLIVADKTVDINQRNIHLRNAREDFKTYSTFMPSEGNAVFEQARISRLLNEHTLALQTINAAIGLDFQGNGGMYYAERAYIQLMLNNKRQAKADLVEAQKYGFKNFDPQLLKLINY
ncbi:MAG: tetratricopeptide repeat protein [Leadbetterella sp.]